MAVDVWDTTTRLLDLHPDQITCQTVSCWHPGIPHLPDVTEAADDPGSACKAHHPDQNTTCTRARDHGGVHAHGNGMYLTAVWAPSWVQLWITYYVAGDGSHHFWWHRHEQSAVQQFCELRAGADSAQRGHYLRFYVPAHLSRDAISGWLTRYASAQLSEGDCYESFGYSGDAGLPERPRRGCGRGDSAGQS